jgi:acyl-CoA synthetase (NDP forming)
MMLETLRPLFRPETVAVIGASRTPGKHGNRPIVYLRKAGFTGEIYPINPGGGEIEGLKVYDSLRSAPKRIDCAFMVIPAAGAVQAMRECAETGVRSVVMANTGFSELGTEEGRNREAEIKAIARAGNVRIVGPNTNGIYNATDRLPLGYNTSHSEPLMPGPASIAAHSGAVFNSVLPRLKQLGAGLSKYVAVGTEVDLTLLDFFEYYVEDPDTKVIGLILEAVSDGERFCALAQRALEAGKPVVALKLGRSEAGAGATIAHSTRLAGSARAYDAIFEEYGIATVPSCEALAGGLATLLSRKNAGESRKLIAIATTGGGSSLLADYAERHGMPLAGEPGGAWGGKVAEWIGSIETAGIVRNPTDTSTLGGHDRLTPYFQSQEADGFDGPMVVFTHMLPNSALSLQIAGQLVERQKRTGSPMVIVAPGGLPPDSTEAYRSAGIPLFFDTDTCFHSLACHYQTLEKRGQTPISSSFQVPGSALAPLLESRARILTELDSAAILRLAGLPMVESRTVNSRDEALHAARAVGYPVVLKALAPGVAHKNKLGFVRTGIADEAALKSALERMSADAAQQGFAKVPFLVQPMKRSSLELIVGVSWEPPFGHFLVAGLGGIYTEALAESRLLPVTVSREAMRKRIAETRVGRVLEAIGGGAFDGTLAALESLQRLVLAHGDRIESIDVNPLLVGKDGCVAVDALVVLRESDGVGSAAGAA